MLTVFYGSDYKKRLAEAEKLAAALLAANLGAPHLKFDERTLSAAALAECAASSGLFSPRLVVEIRDVLADKSLRDSVLDGAKAMAQSENQFLIIEGELDTKALEKLGKSGAVTKEFSVAKAQGKEFNMFALTDALGNRDRKGLWILLQKAAWSGSEAEEIHGILFWQVKTMLSLAVAGNQADKLGIKPFVIQKNQKFLKKYSVDELRQLSRQLIEIYHESRRGGANLDSALEKFILSI